MYSLSTRAASTYRVKSHGLCSEVEILATEMQIASSTQCSTLGSHTILTGVAAL